MFRRREGTGALYADNRRRAPRSPIRRSERQSAMPRGTNVLRPWLQEEPVLGGWSAETLPHLDTADLSQLVEATRAAAGILFELLEGVGEYLQRCRRRREPLDAAVVAEMGDLLDWYIVLFTVGVVDRRGVWLAGRPQGLPRGAGTRRH